MRSGRLRRGPGNGADGLTRRQWCRGTLALAGALAAGGCAAISPTEEREAGRDEAAEVERTVGLVRDPRVVGYVGEIAGRLAQAAQRPDIAWQWSGILGKVSPTLGGIIGGAGRLVSNAALAPYSREQEREADRVGVALAARAGWDPGALAAFLRTLEQADVMARGEPSRPRFFSTHPSTPERVQNVEAIARSLVRTPVAQIAGDRAVFLGRLDGLVVGDNAGNGVFAGATFLHPEFDLAIDMPAHWKTANTPEIVGAVAPDERAIVLLQLVGPGDDPVAGARTDGVAESQLGALRRVTISGLPAAQVIATTRDGDRVGLTWIAHRQRVFRVAGLSAGSDWERYRPALDRTASSFRPLSAADRPRIVQSRLRVRPAVAGETVSQVLARGGSSWTPAQAAVANAVAVDTKLDPGWPVKVAISERYAAALSGRVP
jgi:predicted Zn-dependent protease